ncbi:hypothetical protein WJU16_13440 [Chitinophaga pollutisoli]|uniref:Uncharacterized protein n=1 Tax=Chitinophaga pollutisoli TaxID=3133966 RepID=A0ABZ2YIA5_9BACT
MRYRDGNGRWMVLEAVQPVRVTILEAWRLRNTTPRASISAHSNPSASTTFHILP